MAGSVAPYSPAETQEAADWASFIAQLREPIAADPECTVEDLDSATCEAIDKLRRRGRISNAMADFLAEIFDVHAHA